MVNTLTKDDFLLDEDGRPQVIRYFTQESNLPLTVGLLIDTSGSTRAVLPDERTAAFRFLRQVMREDMDHAFVIHFDFDTELLQDLTSSKKQLESALDQVDSPGLQRRSRGIGGGRQFQRGRFPGGGYPGGGYPGGRGYRRGGTVLYDAIYLAADEIMRKQTGRKALILLSDGVDNGSKETLSNAIEAAQRSDSLVYSILFEDPEMGGSVPFPGMGGSRRGYGDIDGRKIMQQISRETGGRFFEVSKRMPLEKVFATVEEELRSQYSLGYSPDSSDASTSYRRIHLTTRQKNYVVQTREGYYSS